MTDHPAQTRKEITGKKALALLVGFFVMVFAANGIFFYLASQSWTGLSTEKAYERGLRYNDIRARDAAQKKLGWRSTATFQQRGDDLILQTVFVNKAGEPIKGLSVFAEVQRPLVDRHDQRLRLRETGAGKYSHPLDLPLKGQWQVNLRAVTADGFEYLSKTRLFLKDTP